VEERASRDPGPLPDTPTGCRNALPAGPRSHGPVLARNSKNDIRVRTNTCGIARVRVPRVFLFISQTGRAVHSCHFALGFH
jgi:hypothetical protein